MTYAEDVALARLRQEGADPGNKYLRLLRAVYGLCPDCDREDEHVHRTRDDVIRQLVRNRIWQLGNLIREADDLSKPCPEGRWRWGDIDTNGYTRKSPERLAADRETYKRRAAQLREELRLLTQEVAGLWRRKPKKPGARCTSSQKKNSSSGWVSRTLSAC